MPAINLQSLEVDNRYVVVEPVRGSEVVRSEKKYARHGLGRVIVGAKDVIALLGEEVDEKGRHKLIHRDANEGDYVIYDDTDSVEVPYAESDISTTLVEFVPCYAIAGVWRGEKHSEVDNGTA